MLCLMQNHMVQAFANSGNAIKPVSFIRDLKSKSPLAPTRGQLSPSLWWRWGRRALGTWGGVSSKPQESYDLPSQTSEHVVVPTEGLVWVRRQGALTP